MEQKLKRSGYRFSATTAVVPFELKSGSKLRVMRSLDGVLIVSETGDRVAEIELTDEASECLLSALLETRVDKTKPLPNARLRPFVRTKSEMARDIAKVILEQPDAVSKAIDGMWKEDKIEISGATIYHPAGLDGLGKYRSMLFYPWDMELHQSDRLCAALGLKRSRFRKAASAVCKRLKKPNQPDWKYEQPGKPTIYPRAVALEMLADRLANIQRARRERIVEMILSVQGSLRAFLSATKTKRSAAHPNRRRSDIG
jgi:hypothetical protein